MEQLNGACVCSTIILPVHPTVPSISQELWNHRIINILLFKWIMTAGSINLAGFILIMPPSYDYLIVSSLVSPTICFVFLVLILSPGTCNPLQLKLVEAVHAHLRAESFLAYFKSHNGLPPKQYNPSKALWKFLEAALTISP